MHKNRITEFLSDDDSLAQPGLTERLGFDAYGLTSPSDGDDDGLSEEFLWRYFFQGGRHDEYAGLYEHQHRAYQPSLGRWIEHEPAGYVDGANLNLMLGAPGEAMAGDDADHSST